MKSSLTKLTKSGHSGIKRAYADWLRRSQMLTKAKEVSKYIKKNETENLYIVKNVDFSNSAENARKKLECSICRIRVKGERWTFIDYDQFSGCKQFLSDF